MKRSLLPAAILALVLAALAALQLFQSDLRTGYEAPDFALPDLNGTLYRLADFRGQVVLLNLWTTWCPPCRTEMPAMEVLYGQLKQQDFAMLAVSEDESGAESVAPFVRELGLTFPILLDPEATLSPRYGVTGYPETFIIDRNGKVVQHIVGPTDWQSDDWLVYFMRLLAQPDTDDGQPNPRG